MKTDTAAKPYTNPYIGGIFLGIVLFIAYYMTGSGLGASAALSRIQICILDLFASSHVDRVAYFAEKGGGSLIAIDHSSILMLAGTFLGGTISGLLHRRFRVETRRGPRITDRQRWLFAFIGGAIMGYGARLARGCTSGQALSGGAVLAAGSWAFMLCVFAGGYMLAWFVRRLWQ